MASRHKQELLLTLLCITQHFPLQQHKVFTVCYHLVNWFRKFVQLKQIWHNLGCIRAVRCEVKQLPRHVQDKTSFQTESLLHIAAQFTEPWIKWLTAMHAEVTHNRQPRFPRSSFISLITFFLSLAAFSKTEKNFLRYSDLHSFPYTWIFQVIHAHYPIFMPLHMKLTVTTNQDTKISSTSTQRSAGSKDMLLRTQKVSGHPPNWLSQSTW